MEVAPQTEKGVTEPLNDRKKAKERGETSPADATPPASCSTLAANRPRDSIIDSISSPSDPWKIPGKDVSETDCVSDDSVASALEALSDTDRHVLKTAACLGTLDVNLLEAAKQSKHSNITGALTSATELKTIVKRKEDSNEYAFVNDEAQHALYQLLFPSEEEKSRQHATIGRHLLENLTEEHAKSHYYTILRQFKLGEESVAHQKERNAIATLCLTAGEYAVSKSDFIHASLYLDFGISLLSDGTCWRDEYDLTLALYNDAVEVECSLSNFERVDELVSAVLENSYSFRDTLRARASRIYALSTSYHMSQAVEESLQVLKHLGESFPAQPKRFHIARELVKTWRLLKGRTNEMILRMPVMTNENKIQVLQILNLLFPGAYRTQPKLYGLIVLRIVRLTLLYGLSPVSAVGFAFYSGIVSMITGNADGSFRYADLALALVDKFQAKNFIPRVYLGVYGHTSSYRHYSRDVYPKFEYAHQIGLETGDIEFSCLAANLCFMYHIISGDSLVPLEGNAIALSETYKLHRQETALRMVLPMIQFSQNLMGKNADPCKLVGNAIQDESVLSDILTRATKSHDVISVAFLHYFQLVLAYVFNDYEAAAKLSTGLERITLPPYLHPSLSSQYAFYTLSLLSVVNNRRGRARRRILSVARRSIRKMQRFALSTPENCLGKAFLLQAELSAATGKNREAKRDYVSAISVAARYDDKMMLAIACERAAQFLSSDGDNVAAKRCLRDAHDAYENWGAFAKADQLRKEMPAVFVSGA